jgi:tRNA(Ile)-lysidine synthase
MKTLEGLSVLERVLKTISRYNMLGPAGTPETRVIAAVSGGADSVCLVNVLRELMAKEHTGLDARLVGIAHFNHKWRGEASDEDERFVAALAAKLDLPFYRDEADEPSRERIEPPCGAVPLDRAGRPRPAAASERARPGGRAAGEGARPTSNNLEQSARDARREFFSRLIAEGACDRIALGHTRDDQAETVLFRILRGSGLAGLAGIHPTTADGLIRPIVDVTRVEVEEYLRGRGIAWREDQSNGDLKFARNRIRHELLPQLARDWNPKIGEALAHLGDLAFEEERWWSVNLHHAAAGENACPTATIACPTNTTEFQVDRLKALPRSVARRVIRQAIKRAKGDLRGIEFEHVENVVETVLDGLARPRGGVPGVEVAASFGLLRIAPSNALHAAIDPVTISIPGTYATAEGSIRLEIVPMGFANDETPGTACANLKAELAGPIVLRGWRSGDHYRPVGKARDQKLKEMFQSARIPSWRRQGWPILESAGKILWAREFGAAEEFAANAGTGRVLRVSDIFQTRREYKAREHKARV